LFGVPPGDGVPSGEPQRPRRGPGGATIKMKEQVKMRVTKVEWQPRRNRGHWTKLMPNKVQS
jgi:hypothetical protein